MTINITKSLHSILFIISSKSSWGPILGLASFFSLVFWLPVWSPLWIALLGFCSFLALGSGGLSPHFSFVGSFGVCSLLPPLFYGKKLLVGIYQSKIPPFLVVNLRKCPRHDVYVCQPQAIMARTWLSKYSIRSKHLALTVNGGALCAIWKIILSIIQMARFGLK